MLVDLARNDVGRVSVPGSVHVPDLMYVEKYSRVMHLVSHVEGRLKPELNAYDALRGVLPGGDSLRGPEDQSDGDHQRGWRAIRGAHTAERWATSAFRATWTLP